MPSPPTRRTVVVPDVFFTALTSRLRRDIGRSAAHNLLYDIGRDAGRAFMEMAKQVLGRLEDEEDTRKVIRMFGTEYGWADIDLTTFDLNGKCAVVRWKNGVGVPHGGSKEPVCHLGRGLLSGAAEVLFGVACDAVETKCEAMGADTCEFVVGGADRVAEIAERQA